MGHAISALADRLVSAFVPKTTAGACPCGDVWYSSAGCTNACKQCRSSCNCATVTCGPCNLYYVWCGLNG